MEKWIKQYKLFRIRQVATWISRANLLQKWIKQYKPGRIRQIAICNLETSFFKKEVSKVEKLNSVVCLPNPLHFSKSLPWVLCIYALVQNYRCRRHLSEDSELVNSIKQKNVADIKENVKVLKDSTIFWKNCKLFEKLQNSGQTYRNYLLKLLHQSFKKSIKFMLY